MDIRQELTGDEDCVRAVVLAAFPRALEAELVDALRRDGDLVLSLLAVEAGRVVGHCALSALSSPARSLALAPLAVLPEYQDIGIGMRLVREALARAAAGGYAMVFVVGDPDYYGHFGFSAEAATGFSCQYSGRHFMARRLGGSPADITQAEVIYANAFSDTGL